jgi:hypothetical protein
VQAFDLSDRLDTKNAQKGRIRKNSLLNSLFSGNLKVGAGGSFIGQTARYDSNFGNARARSDAISAAAQLGRRGRRTESAALPLRRRIQQSLTFKSSDPGRIFGFR